MRLRSPAEVSKLCPRVFAKSCEAGQERAQAFRVFSCPYQGSLLHPGTRALPLGTRLLSKHL